MHERPPQALAAHLVFLSAAAIYAAAQPRLPLAIDSPDAILPEPAIAAPRIVCEPLERADDGYLRRLTGVIVRTEGAPIQLVPDGCEA